MGFRQGAWLNPPTTWNATDNRLEVTTDAATDFWRETHYGFIRDNGHFYGVPVAGPFTAQFRVQAAYETLYDQAGIMVRIDARTWVKAGIEQSDGRSQLSSVLTVGQSDWATVAYSEDASDFWIRATVAKGVLRLQISRDGQQWPLLRLAPFPEAAEYHVGPMCCTPERAGLKVVFSDFRIGPPLGKALHDLT